MRELSVASLCVVVGVLAAATFGCSFVLLAKAMAWLAGARFEPWTLNLIAGAALCGSALFGFFAAVASADWLSPRGGVR